MSAQSPAVETTDSTTRAQLLALPQLVKLPGAVPLDYVPAAKDRAIAYQKSLVPAHAWFEQQLGIRVPMDLFVLDPTAYARVDNGPSWPFPYSEQDSVRSVIVFPLRIEDMVGDEQKAQLPGEYILYHEAGHNFAHALKIWSGNNWVNELVANMFMAAYINAERPDLKWSLEGPKAHGMKDSPRYTSLRDLDYVYSPGMTPQNYAWFQHEIERLAAFLVASGKFPAVIEKLQAEFPLGTQKQETLDQIIVHLDHIQPGARQFLRPLYGPTTLAHLSPSACTTLVPDPKARPGVIAVRNDSRYPLAVVSPDGTKTLAPATWDEFLMKVGDSLKLPGGTCLIAHSEPALAVISDQ